VKKLLLTVLIAAMMTLPLGTVALADDETPVVPPVENEAYIPGEVPAESGVRFMTPALHAVLLAMENHGVTSFTTDNNTVSWEMLYNLLSMYGQMDARSEYEADMLVLPSETVQDFSSALFSSPFTPDTLPVELTDRIVYSADTDEYRLYCGSDALSDVVITNTHDFGSAVAVSGTLMYLAEGMELARFTATFVDADNMFGYTLVGLDLL